MSGKNNLRDKLEDGELDLSMSQLVEVPVRDIELLGNKVVAINLSHNLLTSLPQTLPLISHITKLDLSKNQLTELPENFGQFRQLKSLDLYANRIEKLPVSFAQLKMLKWLDLKDNPLVPALKQAAGDCITPNDCALCAKKVVALLQSYESQLQRERQRVLEEEMKAQKAQEKREEAERERIRQEKRAAKEKRREEARQREAEVRREADMKISHEMQMNGNGQSHARNGAGARAQRAEEQGSSGSWLGSLVMFLLGLGVAGAGLAISLLWIYTEGKLDSKSVSAALPVIQADVEDYLMIIGSHTIKMYEQAEKVSRPYLEGAVQSGQAAWQEGGKQLRDGAKWAEDNYGELASSVWEEVKRMFHCVWEQVVWAWRQVLPLLKEAWQASKPYFHQLGKFIIEKSLELWQYLQANFPIYMEMVSKSFADAIQFTANTWQKITEAF